jgi:fructose/tagatose bisphosphate aldolase
MPLVPIAPLVDLARRERFAVGYFESWDVASLQGVIDAAEQTQSPIIVGFNGEFLASEERLATERLGLYAALGRAAASSCSVPCGLIFNECPDDRWTREAIELGFNLVMPVAGDSGFDEYQVRVANLVKLAHRREVAVEAELGHLPHGPTASLGFPTEPEEAARFAAATDIDLLAVSVGNVHISTRDGHQLDLDRLGRLQSLLDTPLVLHGGTGVGEQDLRAAIRLGVVKVNYGTYLKRAALRAIADLVPTEMVDDPHACLGVGGARDLLMASRLAVRNAVLERIESLGCCGRALSWKYV